MAISTEQLPDLSFAGQFSVDDLLLIRDVSQNQDFKLKIDTLISALVSNGGQFESIQADIINNRPSAGTANRWFLSTDEPRLYQDDGNSWIEIFGTASGFNEGSSGNQIPTNNTRDARANTYSALQTFNGNIRVDNIEINGNTISSLNTGNINLVPTGAGVVKTDVINEFGTDNGVTIETVLIKDGKVNGVDVSALETDVNGFPDALKNLTTSEINQLENINSVTISNAQWGYVGGLDQSLSTSDSPLFQSVSIANSIIHAGDTDTTISADTDQWQINTGGATRAQIDNSRVTLNVNLKMDGTNIVDINNNQILAFNAVTNAVNSLQISNSASGNAVETEPVGSDSDISRNEKTKGSGTWTINGSQGVDRILSSDDGGNDDTALMNETFVRSLITSSSGGVWVQLATVTTTGTSQILFTSVLSSTYDKYVLLGSDITLGQHMLFRFGNGGSVDTNNNYSTFITSENTSNSTREDGDNSSPTIRPIWKGYNGVSESRIYFSGVNNSRSLVITDGANSEGNDVWRYWGGGQYNNSSTPTDVELSSSSGDIGGVFTLWGITET